MRDKDNTASRRRGRFQPEVAGLLTVRCPFDEDERINPPACKVLNRFRTSRLTRRASAWGNAPRRTSVAVASVVVFPVAARGWPLQRSGGTRHLRLPLREQVLINRAQDHAGHLIETLGSCFDPLRRHFTEISASRIAGSRSLTVFSPRCILRGEAMSKNAPASSRFEYVSEKQGVCASTLCNRSIVSIVVPPGAKFLHISCSSPCPRSTGASALKRRCVDQAKQRLQSVRRSIKREEIWRQDEIGKFIVMRATMGLYNLRNTESAVEGRGVVVEALSRAPLPLEAVSHIGSMSSAKYSKPYDASLTASVLFPASSVFGNMMRRSSASMAAQ